MLEQRKYTLNEIDVMRRAVTNLLTNGLHNPEAPEVEEVLRTYMLNGTDPEELSQKAQDWVDAD